MSSYIPISKKQQELKAGIKFLDNAESQFESADCIREAQDDLRGKPFCLDEIICGTKTLFRRLKRLCRFKWACLQSRA